MSTSIIDYIFRELAITYLDRQDLAQVKLEDLGVDAGVDAVSKQPEYESEEVMYERIVPFAEPSPFKFNTPRSGHVESEPAVKLDISHPKSDPVTAAVTPRLLKAEPAFEASASVGGGIATEVISPPLAATSMRAGDTTTRKVQEAKAKGYEGDPCRECGQFTMVRNGTCLKCNTCGSTSGCS